MDASVATQVEMDAGASTFAAGSAVFKSDDRPAVVLVLGNRGHRFTAAGPVVV
jgi:hypothetical protein